MEAFKVFCVRFFVVILVILSCFDSSYAQFDMNGDGVKELLAISRTDSGFEVLAVENNGDSSSQLTLIADPNITLPLVGTWSNPNKVEFNGLTLKETENGNVIEIVKDGVSKTLLSELPSNDFRVLEPFDINGNGINDIGIVFTKKSKYYWYIAQDPFVNLFNEESYKISNKTRRRDRRRGKFVVLGRVGDKTAIARLRPNKVALYSVRNSKNGKSAVVYSCAYPCRRAKKRRLTNDLSGVSDVSPFIVEDANGSQVLTVKYSDSLGEHISFINRRGKIKEKYLIPNGLNIVSASKTNNSRLEFLATKETSNGESNVLIGQFLKNSGSLSENVDFLTDSQFVLENSKPISTTKNSFFEGASSGINEIPTKNRDPKSPKDKDPKKPSRNPNKPTPTVSVPTIIPTGVPVMPTAISTVEPTRTISIEVPTSVPTVLPSATNTVPPISIPTNTPTSTFTPLPTLTFTSRPTNTATPRPTFTYTPFPTSTPTRRPTATFTPRPSNTPTLRPTATFTATPTRTATIRPTSTFTPRPTHTPTPRPTATFTPRPTSTPTATNTPIIFAAKSTPTPTVAPTFAPVKAFPGAEGAGSDTTHSRGGYVIEVTSLADSGAGTLREALSASGKRTIVFRVGGEIKLNSPLVIFDPYVMIAGQTAPGDGIAISGHQLVISTHDVVVRHMRFRTDGYVQGDGNQIDSIEIWPNYPWNPYKGEWIHNIIIDHCSVSWGSDENISTNGHVKDTTIQWSIISEGLHQIAGSGRGMILSPLSRNISIHHNLFAHNPQRNPLSRGSTSFDFRNNVIYNWRYAGLQFENGWSPYETSPTVANIVGNYFKQGADLGDPESRFHRSLPDLSKIYLGGNIGPRRPNDLLDNWLISSDQGIWSSVAPDKYKANSEFAFPTVRTTSAEVAYDEVLADAGARVPLLDAVDTRILNSTKNGTGRILMVDISEVGGMPNYRNGTAPLDTDHDGMPDSWEDSKGLNSRDTSDGATDRNGDGYTNLEEYLNELASQR